MLGVLGAAYGRRAAARCPLAERHATLGMGIAAAIAVAGVIAGLWAWRRSQQPITFPVHIEYWVYLPSPEMPSQEAVMTWLVAENPFHRPGKPPIGPKEGLMLSDIRLHIGIALRSKNPFLFRPDVFETSFGLTPEGIAAIARSEAVVQMRFVSEQPVPDGRQLAFMPHLAAAYADLGGGQVIFDKVQGRMFSKEELFSYLADDIPADLHLRTSWNPETSEVVTHGLGKVGLSEWATSLDREDKRSMVAGIVQTAAEKAFESAALPEGERVRYLDDDYVVSFVTTRKEGTRLQIGRIEP
ncbi:MAG: hypothetical protein HONBIEJF_01206 [Fimbriimonadaceae bacterium]|nr:hypothetical protein [Fimbriimonadaceae bacterium]